MESRSKYSDSPLSVHSSFASFSVITENLYWHRIKRFRNREEKKYLWDGQVKWWPPGLKLFRIDGHGQGKCHSFVTKLCTSKQDLGLSPCCHSRSVCYLLQEGAPLSSLSAAWQYTINLSQSSLVTNTRKGYTNYLNGKKTVSIHDWVFMLFVYRAWAVWNES